MQHKPKSISRHLLASVGHKSAAKVLGINTTEVYFKARHGCFTKDEVSKLLDCLPFYNREYVMTELFGASK
jgi:hypothetical protein